MVRSVSVKMLFSFCVVVLPTEIFVGSSRSGLFNSRLASKEETPPFENLTSKGEGLTAGVYPLCPRLSIIIVLPSLAAICLCSVDELPDKEDKYPLFLVTVSPVKKLKSEDS